MSVLFSDMEKTRAPDGEDAWRAWLISRQQSPIVHHSSAMNLKRLRVLARKIGSHAAAVLATIHWAIIVAKLRRVQRELRLHTSDLRDYPQQPLILGEKWDS